MHNNWGSLLLCLTVVILSTVTECAEEARVLRRRGGGSKRDGVCDYNGPRLFMNSAGERTATVIPNDFLKPYPDFHFHRDLMGYNDDDILQMRADVIDFFLLNFGVDFRNSPIDPMTGAQMSEDMYFMLMPVHIDFGFVIPSTSVHGVFECPRPVLDAGISMMVVADGGTYYGAFGGTEGRPAYANDLLPWGHFMIDFDLDGVPAIFHYEPSPVDGPARPDATGNMAISCALFSEMWGEGQIEGKFDFNTRNADGFDHVSVRTSMLFPARWNL